MTSLRDGFRFSGTRAATLAFCAKDVLDMPTKSAPRSRRQKASAPLVEHHEADLFWPGLVGGDYLGASFCLSRREHDSESPTRVESFVTGDQDHLMPAHGSNLDRTASW